MVGKNSVGGRITGAIKGMNWIPPSQASPQKREREKKGKRIKAYIKNRTEMEMKGFDACLVKAEAGRIWMSPAG